MIATAQRPKMQDIVALSPDARYLVVGRKKLHVWDLRRLPHSRHPQPIHTHTLPDAAGSMRFIDGHTLEITAAHGTHRWHVDVQ